MFGGRVSTLLIPGGLAIGIIAGLVGCGGGSPELTTEQQLEKLAGRRLTSAEVAEQLALADFLCGFDNRVLVEIWMQLDARQLEFQDYVFGQHCPDRLSIYDETRPDTGTAPVPAATTVPEQGDGAGLTDEVVEGVDVLDGIEPAVQLPERPPTTTGPDDDD